MPWSWKRTGALAGRPAAGGPPRRLASFRPAQPWATPGRRAPTCSGTPRGRPTPIVGDALVEAMARLPWPLLWLEGAALARPAMAGLAGSPGRRRHDRRLPRPMARRTNPDRSRWPACQERWSSHHRRNLARGIPASGRPRQGTLRRRRSSRAATKWKPRCAKPSRSKTPAGKGRPARRCSARRACSTSSSARPGNWPRGTNWPWRSSAAAAGRSPSPTVWRPRGSSTPGRSATTPAYADCSPGQLLRYRLIEWLHAEGQYGALDFVGPLNDAQARWHPDTYPVGRLMVAPRRWLARLALRAYERCGRVAPQSRVRAGRLFAVESPQVPTPSLPWLGVVERGGRPIVNPAGCRSSSIVIGDELVGARAAAMLADVHRAAEMRPLADLAQVDHRAGVGQQVALVQRPLDQAVQRRLVRRVQQHAADARPGS